MHEFTIDFDVIHFGEIVARNGDLQVIDCTRCGFAHLYPIPPDKETTSYYEEGRFYREHSPSDWLAKEKREYDAGLWDSAFSWYASHLAIQSVISTDWASFPPVVDVGCGQGLFLQYYRQHQSVIYGVEPDPSCRDLIPTAIKCYPGVHGIASDIRPVTDHPHTSVRMALTLEHIANPLAFTYAAMLLRGRAGALQIVVPNEFNPLQQRVRKRVGDWFVQEPHINYWSKASIASFVERIANSFVWINMNTLANRSVKPMIYTGGTFPMELFYLAGLKYIGNDAIGRKCHIMRLEFEKRAGINAWKLYRLLYNKLGWGRESIITVRPAELSI